jgi:hypothetical protein
MEASAKATTASDIRPDTNAAIPVIQKARNGRSDSNEFPFTTKAGTETNNNVAPSGQSENRRAKTHMPQTATTENSA